MKAIVDLDLCTACGLCCEICPSVFEVRDEGAFVTVGEVPRNAEEDCREAAESCPVEAISIQE